MTSTLTHFSEILELGEGDFLLPFSLVHPRGGVSGSLMIVAGEISVDGAGLDTSSSSHPQLPVWSPHMASWVSLQPLTPLPTPQAYNFPVYPIHSQSAQETAKHDTIDISPKNADGQKAHEKMINIANYQRNANQNYSEVSRHSGKNGHHQKIYKQ